MFRFGFYPPGFAFSLESNGLKKKRPRNESGPRKPVGRSSPIRRGIVQHQSSVLIKTVDVYVQHTQIHNNQTTTRQQPHNNTKTTQLSIFFRKHNRSQTNRITRPNLSFAVVLYWYSSRNSLRLTAGYRLPTICNAKHSLLFCET